MKRFCSFLVLLHSISALSVAGQDASSNKSAGTVPSSTALVTALIQDLQAGKLEQAHLHVIQLQIVLLPSASTSDQILNALKASATKILPDDANATAPFLRSASDLQLAVSTGDSDAARQLAARLGTDLGALHVSKSHQHLAATIEQISDASLRAYLTVAEGLRDALRSGDVQTAEALATEVLPQAQVLAKRSRWSAWLVGADLYNAYDALGRAAFNRGDYQASIQYLQEAATTPGTTTLHTFGPNLILARQLLERGYADEVITFLTKCKNFWQSPLIDPWIAQIKAGQYPTFSPNIKY